jgi:hypothetical protein
MPVRTACRIFRSSITIMAGSSMQSSQENTTASQGSQSQSRRNRTGKSVAYYQWHDHH